MQLDMHYYGTYAMARAAGITPEAAQMIATCAQFVDDNVARKHVQFKDGARIDAEATAHHTVDGANLDEGDQRQVWVPFHFLPGNIGESYTERLKCRMDSDIAREMIDHHMNLADRDFAVALMGVAAHVYADTFSHYGFSGVSSRGNKVDNDSFKFHEEVEGLGDTIESLTPKMRAYVIEKADEFFARRGEHGGLLDNIVSFFAEELSGALGHGSVATYPDRPYLVWSFEYERGDVVIEGTESIRNNPMTFLQGCRALHSMFQRFVDISGDGINQGDARAFEDIEEAVLGILVIQAEKEGRIEAWQDAAGQGAIFGPVSGEAIPPYEGESWNKLWRSLNNREKYTEAIGTPVWLFYQAASLHRTYVIRDLLPKYDLIVD